MTDSTTAHYGWAYPTVNADANTWGTTLNNAIIAIDAQVFTNAGAACQTAQNLNDLANKATARTNLGLGSAATHASTDFDAAGTAASQASAAQLAAQTYAAGVAGTAQSNAESYAAGVASTAQSNAESYADSNKLAIAQNLNDLANKPTARANLGLGSIATTNITVSSSAPSGAPGNGDVWYQI